jgi:hypothetical protein
MRHFIPLLSAICLLLTASCTAVPSADPPWACADLRRLDPAGDAAAPEADLLAVYTRLAGHDLQIRLDLLDLPLADDADFEIRLWDNARYARAPLVIQIPASGRLALLQPPGVDSPMQARLSRDPALDTLTLRLNRHFIGERYRFDIRAYSPDSSTPADEALGIRSDDPPPLARAPLLIAFTGAFPAATPAQALRRWDGAHTGPTGERHGLRHVLENAERARVPIALLDLKTPASLSALDFMGQTRRIRQLAEAGLLLLPEVAYGSPSAGYHFGEPADIALDFSRRAAEGFGLPASLFVYAAAPPEVAPATRYLFVSLPDASRLARRAGQTLIPLPALPDGQATAGGPSLEVRGALMDAALSPDPADLVVLGGSLPHSTWGQADSAKATFDWLAAHPWIHALDGDDLLTFPIGADDGPAAPGTTSTTSLPDLLSAPANAITDSAWQAYFMLTAPTDDAQLAELKGKYIHQLFVLWSASEWAENPTSEISCWENSVFETGGNHCILANEHFYAVIAPNGARLTHLFYLDAAGPRQLVAPSSQFIVGLSDPSTWQLDQGEAADPSVLPGAFFDATSAWMRYEPVISADAITLTSADGSRLKTFRLTESGLVVTYRAEGPISTRLPLVVDPRAFFSGPSEYRAVLAPDSWTWGLVDGSRLRVRTDAPFAAQGFTAAIPFLSRPENPNLDYPPGHYYPFPLSIVEIHADGDFIVEITPQK